MRIYLDNVDEEHDHCINGVLLTPYCYGRSILEHIGPRLYLILLSLEKPIDSH